MYCLQIFGPWPTPYGTLDMENKIWDNTLSHRGSKLFRPFYSASPEIPMDIPSHNVRSNEYIAGNGQILERKVQGTSEYLK